MNKFSSIGGEVESTVERRTPRGGCYDSEWPVSMDDTHH